MSSRAQGLQKLLPVGSSVKIVMKNKDEYRGVVLEHGDDYLICDFPHNLTSFLKHNLATQGSHSSFQRRQAVNTLKDILAASLLCEA